MADPDLKQMSQGLLTLAQHQPVRQQIQRKPNQPPPPPPYSTADDSKPDPQFVAAGKTDILEEARLTSGEGFGPLA